MRVSSPRKCFFFFFFLFFWGVCVRGQQKGKGVTLPHGISFRTSHDHKNKIKWPLSLVRDFLSLFPPAAHVSQFLRETACRRFWLRHKATSFPVDPPGNQSKGANICWRFFLCVSRLFSLFRSFLGNRGGASESSARKTGESGGSGGGQALRVPVA